MDASGRQVSPWGYAGVLAGAVLAVLAAVLAGIFYAGRSIPWSYASSDDGSLVRVEYTGGECDRGDSAEVDETATTVTITVRVRELPWESCGDVGRTASVEVSLDAPLAGRQLIDGACLSGETASYVACHAGPERSLAGP
jgi:hypothetical protein